MSFLLDHVALSLFKGNRCPHCHASIGLEKREASFVCPVCGCLFRHNYTKWLLAIPEGAIISIAIMAFLPDLPVNLAIVLTIALVTLATAMFPNYTVIKSGNKQGMSAVTAPPPPFREKHWTLTLLKIFLLALLAAIAIVLAVYFPG